MKKRFEPVLLEYNWKGARRGARGGNSSISSIFGPAMYAARVLVALTCKAHQVDYLQWT